MTSNNDGKAWSNSLEAVDYSGGSTTTWRSHSRQVQETKRAVYALTSSRNPAILIYYDHITTAHAQLPSPHIQTVILLSGAAMMVQEFERTEANI